MRLGSVVALFADVHGATGTLERALSVCRSEAVDTVALLGDLFDRAEQADGCAATLDGWNVVGVYGNHEREVAEAAAAGRLKLCGDTIALLSGLSEQVCVDDTCLVHEAERWGIDDPMQRLFGNGTTYSQETHSRITFAGHTHYRHARDERGALDIGRGTLSLDPLRRYLINPGALLIGQFAIWDRDRAVVYFRQVQY